MPSGCTDIISSNNETTEQKESKENKEELSENTEQTLSKDDAAEKSEKSEKLDKMNRLQNTTYIFTRYSKQPAVVIPSADHFTTAVRCCPTIFKLRDHKENCPPMIDLPYRMVYAVASKTSVYLYDTQQRLPFGSISNIHYSRLTDITWSNDGKILIASSFDGFCTLIAFEDGELGEVYDQPINLIDTDEKENQSKKKRNSKDGNNKTSPKIDPQSLSTPTTPSISTNDNAQLVIKQKIEIPETMIASVETFESPEYKEKQATPIAVRRQPRTTPTSKNATPTESTGSTTSAKKPKLIAIRRQPRSILHSPVVSVEKSADQDEALDAWPIPIDSIKTVEEDTIQSNKETKKSKIAETITIGDETEDMRLIYEGESESTLIKPDTSTDTKSATVSKCTPTDGKLSETTAKESSGTPDMKNSRTPRRVQLRTISTPKSKKKLIN